ncbi:hypothetical protein A5906_15070 [Bradyrhizobium sacchari]|uniref:Glycosyltransferase RgtA/B/C/D-like domain-containing protein n=1 Tax=Bradyrhizobium sacchari TaxID=1399419 RepID=A0A560JMP3_9BRAD|nr:hypothetical protein [Bradyrhizobium sacchari]OPY94263.1 hypothetical protein A5906_15070 [Bradyrhizobium sacchari]TWB59202.1 hypothetical protein FBZ94_105478 [Bradyrhizobium sacchari]TWB72438.1 hypothetical protein FBZ95_106153 [Bradyrhizobium sacchari]
MRFNFEWKVMLAHKMDFTIVIVALFVLAGIGSQLWQPFMLGFEHDDWWLFVRPYVLRDYSNYHPDRPGYFLLSQLILHIWNGSPAEFHWLKVIINLATASSIFWLTLSIQRLFDVSSSALAVGAAVLWLTAPWGMGYTIWATAAFTNVALLSFCASMVQFVRWVELGSWVRFVAATLLWIVSIETYQSTWFGFVPVALAILLSVYERKDARGRLFALAFVLLVIQLACVFHTATTTPKSHTPNTFWIFGHNLRILIEIQIRYLGPFLFAAVLLVVASLIRAAARDGREGYLQLRRIIAGFALAVLGSCGSALLYAAAGYGFTDTGEQSKTSVMFTFWIGIGFSLVVSASAEDRKGRIIGIATLFIAIVATIFSFPSAADPWVIAWERQREVINAIGQQSFPRKLEPGDVVLGDLPSMERNVPVFGAPWSATALLILWEDVVPNIARQPITILSFDGDYNMAWEPGKLTIRPGWEVAGKRLWLWRWRTGEAVLVRSPGPLPRGAFDALFERNQ